MSTPNMMRGAVRAALDSQSDIPTSLTYSPTVDTTGAKWVDFFFTITGNTTPLTTQLDGQVEAVDSNGEWHPIPVEEFAAGTGQATQYVYNWIRAVAGNDKVVPITVPVIGVLGMRIGYKGNGADTGSTITLEAHLRFN